MPDKDAIRAELELTRAAYHDLLDLAARDDWTCRSGNPDMTVKQLMWHTAWSMGWIAGSIDAVKSGKSVRAPAFLLEPGRRLAMRWLARNATPELAARKYDEGHAALLAKLDAVRDDEWGLEASRFGEVRNVAWYFSHVHEHFEEHARDVRAVVTPRAAVADG
jgi:hypothetical protein